MKPLKIQALQGFTILFKLVSQEINSNISDSACATFCYCIRHISRYDFDRCKNCPILVSAHITCNGEKDECR